MSNPDRPVIISVENVFKSVTDSTGTLDILRDIDFTLSSQETAAIVGASGSCKSTLLSIIAGLDTPTRGTVRLAGQDIFAINEDDRAALRAQKVGFVFQSFQLLGNLTALENVMLPLELAGRKDSRKAATEMLGKMHAAGYRSIELSKQSGLWDFMDEVDRLLVPQDLQEALEKLDGAKEFFYGINDSSKRFVLRWLKLAKTEKTRKARILQLAELSAKGEKLKGS